MKNKNDDFSFLSKHEQAAFRKFELNAELNLYKFRLENARSLCDVNEYTNEALIWESKIGDTLYKINMIDLSLEFGE